MSILSRLASFSVHCSIDRSPERRCSLFGLEWIIRWFKLLGLFTLPVTYCYRYLSLI